MDDDRSIGPREGQCAQTAYAASAEQEGRQIQPGAPPQAVAVPKRLEAAQPDNALALFYLGAASFAGGDKAGAAHRWKKLLALLPPDAPIRAMLEEKIRQAGERPGLSPVFHPGDQASDCDGLLRRCYSESSTQIVRYGLRESTRHCNRFLPFPLGEFDLTAIDERCSSRRAKFGRSHKQMNVMACLYSAYDSTMPRCPGRLGLCLPLESLRVDEVILVLIAGS